MPTEHVDLSDRQAEFIRISIESGLFKDASEIIRAGLRLLEQQCAEDEAKLEALRRIAKESVKAFERGEFTTYSVDSMRDRLKSIGDDVRSRHARP